jgi:enterochelin esterase-like enzyme
MSEQFVWLLTAVLLLNLIFFTVAGRYRHRQLLDTIEIITMDDFPSQYLGNTRPIHIFLPPNHRNQVAQSSPVSPLYKVLYLNDGQDAEQLKLRETLARLTDRGWIEPIIVVAIPTNENRLHEYGTAVTANAQGYGSQAAAYARFLTEELMPVIEREFPVKSGPANTAIMGISLGGLSAFDIAWNHPHLFGTAGVFSGSFWWRAGEDDPYIPPNHLITHERVRRSDYRPCFRAWFQAATRDETSDRDNNGIIDAIQDTLELIDELAAVGYERGRDVIYVQVEGGRHNYHTWAHILPQFLEWAFPLLVAGTSHEPPAAGNNDEGHLMGSSPPRLH